MKFVLKVLIVLLLFVQPCFSAMTDVLVLPADLLNTKENYYNFDEVSEIVSNDIINLFNKSNGKISSPDIYTVRAKLNQDNNKKSDLQAVLTKYKNSGSVNYSVIRNIADYFNCKYVLLISSSAVTNKNSLKRSVWEVLEIASDFDVVYPYRLETSLILIDASSGTIIWSNNYSTKLGANDNIFAAKNYAQANGEYEKIKLYSYSVVAPSASQNIVLRFYPKSVKPVEAKIEDTGGALRYDKRLPEKPKLRQDEPYTGDLLFEF